VAKIEAVEFMTLAQIESLALVRRQSGQFICVQKWRQNESDIFRQFEDGFEQRIGWRPGV